MRDVFDIYTIIFLALAVFIFLRLRSVLGQRTGRERPPYDPYSAREPVRPAPEKVVALPNRTAETVTPKPAEPVENLARTLEGHCRARIGHRDGSRCNFAAPTPISMAKHFLTGARAAYEMIVNAYAEGDRRTLKNLLAREVYDGFESAISEREKRGETVESRFVSIDNADITAAELRGRNAQVTVRFQSKLVSVTRDKDGNVIDGNAEKVTDITDVWTFARDVTSRDPNWKLLATEAGQ